MGISIGLVGLGSFGSSFADLFYSHPLVDRVALCDRDPERIAKFASKPSWAKKFNPRDQYNSLDEILKSDLDALVVITQPWLHAPQCIAAMEAGKHVYSAVPVINLPDVDQVKFTGVDQHIVDPTRADVLLQHADEILDAEAIGFAVLGHDIADVDDFRLGVADHRRGAEGAA